MQHALVPSILKSPLRSTEFSLEDLLETPRIDQLIDDESGEKFRLEVQDQKSVLLHRGLKRGDVVSLQGPQPLGTPR